MNATLICYTLEKATPTQRVTLSRIMHGYTDFSNNAKYKYERKGLVEELSCLNPHNSVLIIKRKDKSKILEILQKYKAKVIDFEIQISSKYFKK